MKKLLLILFIPGLFLAACNQDTEKVANDQSGSNVSTEAIQNPNTASDQPQVDPENAPVMSFSETEFDFGNIKDTEMAEHSFKFTNTGKTDLVITDAKGSCGCTVPYFPKNPIPPGGTEEIKVSFNAKGQKGKQTKTVTLTANTVPNTMTLRISAEVEGDGSEQQLQVN